MAPSPTLTHTATRLYDALAPLAAEDESNDWALAHLCAAVARTIDEVADLSRDTADGSPGWSQLFDPETVPAAWLPWVGQFIGVDVPDALDEAGQRLRIKGTAGFRRGSVGALKAAAQQRLTGTRTVNLLERHGGEWYVTVSTLAAETPSPTTAIVRDLAEQKPAGIILVHRVVSGVDFDTVRDMHLDFATVTRTYTTFNGLKAEPAKQEDHPS